MDSYDYHQIDKAMSKSIEEIFSNPARHKFYSCFEAYERENIIGIRGGKVKGKKRTCFHCGQKEKGHAAVTEDL